LAIVRFSIFPRKDVTPFERQNKTGEHFRSMGRKAAIESERDRAVTQIELVEPMGLCLGA
jgi:hypothetical protein